MAGNELSVASEIDLRDPVMIAAFRGWNDAGDAASFAAQHLGRSWRSKKFAWIEPEDFFDFQAVRPHVKLIDGVTRQISWPSNDFFAARVDGGPHDIVVLVGTEPNLRWRTFAGLITDVAKAQGVGLVITLGALLADVPHSRPTQITGTAISEELVNRLGLKRSGYEGPTGIVGVLHDACGKAGIESASLWAAVPHYLAVNPNPKAALALVEKTVELVGAPVAIEELARATTTYEEQVGEMVASDEDVQAYVRLLEQRADEGEEGLDPSNLPSGDALADELERFLRERGEGPGAE